LATVTAISKAILSFRDLQSKLGLHRSDNASFFLEWQAPATKLSEIEKLALQRLAQKYLTYLEEHEFSDH
jgi:hypothetical protein